MVPRLHAVLESIAVLTVARAIIGWGFAGGLMSGFKAIVLWVPEPRRALANGEFDGEVMINGLDLGHLTSQLGPEEWDKGMNPDVPETKVMYNPYTFTQWDAGSAQWKH